jgi:hypothetical protein
MLSTGSKTTHTPDAAAAAALHLSRPLHLITAQYLIREKTTKNEKTLSALPVVPK